MNIILFTPRIIKDNTIKIEFLNMIKNRNIGINITDMAKYPNHTIDIINKYLEMGIDPNKLTCHVASKSRDKKGTDHFLYFLKDKKINKILCVNGDMTGMINKHSDAYSVYDVIEQAKHDFTISLSAYPENVSNRYCAFDHNDIIHKKLKILADGGYSHVTIFFQHSYQYDSVKNMSEIVKKIGRTYHMDIHPIPSVLPLFNPKYVFNVSGDHPVNHNSVHIPIEYVDILHNNNTLTTQLYDETIKMINKFKTINGNLSIYHTNNTDLMIKLINELPE